MLAVTAFLFLYSDKKMGQRSLTDAKVAVEVFSPLAMFFDKIYYILFLSPLFFQFFTTIQISYP